MTPAPGDSPAPRRAAAPQGWERGDTPGSRSERFPQIGSFCRWPCRFQIAPSMPDAPANDQSPRS